MKELTDIPQLGPEKKKILNHHNIYTIADLANCDTTQHYYGITHNQLLNWVAIAQKNVNQIVTLNPEKKTEELKKIEEQNEQFKYYISDHNWWEKEIYLLSSPVNVSGNNFEFHRAKIKEICIDPTNLLNVVCIYNILIPDPDDAQQQISKTIQTEICIYYILFFNHHLPDLNINIKSKDMDDLGEFAQVLQAHLRKIGEMIFYLRLVGAQ